jgi:G3E family GTPase
LRIPISLITGSLGSGKTTLLRHILAVSGQRLAVLMNEFGEIAVDSRVLPGENLRIIELAGGCVCCELSGEFEAAVNEILERFQPERIVVEATGVAEADALASEVQDNIPQVRLDGVIHIVDAYASREHPGIGYAARSQIQQADIILINKCDLVGRQSVADAELRLRENNGRARFLNTVRCEADPDLLFGHDAVHRAGTPRPKAGHPYQSFVFESDRVLDRGRFESAVAGLPPAVYRAKGFVRFAEGDCLFNYVAGRMDLDVFAADKTQLVFIGPEVKAVRDKVLGQFRAAEL